MKNNKRAIAKVQKNSNRHGGKNVTIQNDSTGDITNWVKMKKNENDSKYKI